MAHYTSVYPDVAIDPMIKKFFEDFYRTSDTPDAHDAYVNAFTPDATVIMASNRCQGSDAIRDMRLGLWEKVESRRHHPMRVFPFGANARQVMLYGTVDYHLKAGGDTSVDWAARAELVEYSGGLRMNFYQVYLISAAKQPK